MFQDDILKCSNDIKSAQDGCYKMEVVTGLKQLQINIDKSVFMLLGNKSRVGEIREMITRNPLLFKGQALKEKQFDKYLGDQIGESTTASVEKTVSDRYWRIMSFIREVQTVISDCRAETTGAVTSGLLLWQMAGIPVLLNNAGSWTDISSSTIKKLNDLQLTMIRYLLKMPRSTPTPILNWDVNLLTMENQIISQKLNLAHHIATLDENSLANEIFVTQKQFKFPGLAQEVSELVTELDLPDITDRNIAVSWSKAQWKKLVKKTIHDKCEKELKESMRKYSKLKDGPMMDEKFELRDYLKNMKLQDARVKFALR